MVAAVKMPDGLAPTLRTLDWAMILYWSVMTLAWLGVFALPAAGHVRWIWPAGHRRMELVVRAA